MNAYTIAMYDLLIASAFALVIVAWFAYAFWRTDRILRDPDHPDHEDYKEAVKAGFEQAERDRLRFP